LQSAPSLTLRRKKGKKGGRKLHFSHIAVDHKGGGGGKREENLHVIAGVNERVRRKRGKKRRGKDVRSIDRSPRQEEGERKEGGEKGREVANSIIIGRLIITSMFQSETKRGRRKGKGEGGRLDLSPPRDPFALPHFDPRGK